jgi:hypothetical protein
MRAVYRVGIRLVESCRNIVPMWFITATPSYDDLFTCRLKSRGPGSTQPEFSWEVMKCRTNRIKLLLRLIVDAKK